MVETIHSHFVKIFFSNIYRIDDKINHVKRDAP